MIQVFGMWSVFCLVIIAMIVVDLKFWNGQDYRTSPNKNLLMSGFYLGVGLLFSVWIGHTSGLEKAQDYLTAFLIEKSLSLDNIFIISVIFQSLSIPLSLQHRVLFYGFSGVIILRGLMIVSGSALIHTWSWVLDGFSIILILTGIKMLVMKPCETPFEDRLSSRLIRRFLPFTPHLHQEAFWVQQKDGRKGMRWRATPLFLALILIEFSDIIFAMDSVPAVFSVTQDLYVVYTSNIFAILGLRSLYGVLSAAVDRIRTLQPTLAVLLVFIGSKGFIAHFLKLDAFPSLLSLIIACLILTIGLSWGWVVTCLQKNLSGLK